MALEVLGSQGPVKSSLPFQMLLYTHGWYCCMFFPLELAIVWFKSSVLPYPARSMVSDAVLQCTLALVEPCRNAVARRANATESAGHALVLGAPALAACVYMAMWQTYVLGLDIVLLAIEALFLLLHTAFAVIAIGAFAR